MNYVYLHNFLDKTIKEDMKGKKIKYYNFLLE